MKGSAIDRSLSYARIDATLNRNQQVQQYHAAREANQPFVANQLRESIRQSVQAEYRHSPDAGKGLLQILLEPQFVAAAPDPTGDADITRKKRKKHEAEQSQSQGISR